MTPALYRKNAEECRQQAERATFPKDKEARLRLAEQWLKMAHEAQPKKLKDSS